MGSQATAVGDLLSLPTRFWSVGPQLIQSLFDAGKRRSEVRLTEATYDATVANYRQTVLSAVQQVEDGLAQLRILAEEAEVASRAVDAAQRSLEYPPSNIVEGSRTIYRSSPHKPARFRINAQQLKFSHGA